MKKFVILTVSLFCALALIFSGCTAKSETAEGNAVVQKTASAKESEPQDSGKTEKSSGSSLNSSRNADSSSDKNESTEKQKDGLNDITFSDKKQLPVYDYCAAQLNETQEKYYNIILSALNEVNGDEISVAKAGEDTILEENLRIAFSAVLLDHPEIFWVGNSYQTLYNSDNKSYYIKIDYDITDKSEIAEMQKKLDDKINILLSQLTNMSYFEKELFFHNYLCRSVSYNKSETKNNSDYTVYGALVSGKAVCEGYAKAMKLLCNKAGINCLLVRGKLINDDSPHMWNIVEIAGEWYQLDVTWDDSETGTVYKYFNITDKQMYESRKADISITGSSAQKAARNSSFNIGLPICTAEDYSNAKIG